MSMTKIVLAGVSYLLGRSRRLRKLLPFVPIALAIGQYLSDRRAARRLAPPTYGERPGASSQRPAVAPAPAPMAR